MATNPPSSSRSAHIAMAVSVILHGSLAIVLLFVMVCVVPRYKREFANYKMQLPQLTEWVVALSDWVVAYWYVVVLFALPLLALDGGIVFLSWPKRGTRILGVLWIVLLVLIWLSIMAVVALSLWLPHWKLLESLSR